MVLVQSPYNDSFVISETEIEKLPSYVDSLIKAAWKEHDGMPELVLVSHETDMENGILSMTHAFDSPGEVEDDHQVYQEYMLTKIEIDPHIIKKI